MSAVLAPGQQAIRAARRRMLPAGLLAPALFAVAAGLVLAGLAWPFLTLPHRESLSRAAATALLERAEEVERAWARAHRCYLPLPAEATPPPEPVLMPGEAEDFQLDGFPRPDGSLRLRVVSRPAAILAGRLTPLLLTATLPAPTPRETSCNAPITEPAR